MIIFILVLAFIVLFNSRVRSTDVEILSRKDTTVINAIFVLCIFFSHSSQYLQVNGGFLDSLYRHFQNFHNQWVVATFLSFSGFGVMSQIENKGGDYVSKFPKKRILKTLFNFDIAVLLYMLLNMLVQESYSPLTYVGSFIGLTSVGNSNWYIFAILVMYTISYLSAIFYKESYRNQAIAVTVGTIVYIVAMQLIGMPSRFISTIFCYPLGVWFAIYKDEVAELFRKKKIIILFVMLIVLGATYKLRYNDYIMNLASCVFVLTVVWFSIFFEIKSKALYFIGQHAFSIFILQRIPMLIFYHYELLINQPYVFVIVNLIITIAISVGFDKALGVIDKKIFV